MLATQPSREVLKQRLVKVVVPSNDGIPRKANSLAEDARGTCGTPLIETKQFCEPLLMLVEKLYYLRSVLYLGAAQGI